MTRRGAGVAVALGLAAACLASAVVMAAIVWTLVASPLTATTGTATTFTMTATNAVSGRIRCLWVDVPGNFTVAGSQVLGSTAGNAWTSSVTGNRVRVWTTSGGDELHALDSVQFTISATPVSPGSLAWAASAFADQGCTGQTGLVGVPPVVVVSGPIATPTPVPTVRPTPVPTPRTTPAPTPSTFLPPVVVPSVLVPPAVASPGAGEPNPSTAATPAPTRASAASPVNAVPPPPNGEIDGGAGPTAEAPTGRESPGIRLAVALGADDGVQLDIGTVDVMASVDVYAVPAAAIAIPGLVVLIWLGLQTIGALAWIPAVRRLRGRDDRTD